MDWTAGITGLGGFVAGCAAAYVMILKAKRDNIAAQAEADVLRRKADGEAAVKLESERVKERRAEATEYKRLYAEVKAELSLVKQQDKACQRQLHRLELALVRANIPLPPLEDDDTGDGAETK